MDKNFKTCPHCALLGKQKLIRPAIHGPLLSRSDGRTFHLYLEECGLHRRPSDEESEAQIYALFRYDLNPVSVKSESTVIMIQETGDDENRRLAKLEEAAELLAQLLASAEVPRNLYKLTCGRLSPITSRFRPPMTCAPELRKPA
jgi:hypothetical protein